VRHDRVDKAGRVTLRYLSRLHHIGVGRAHIGEPIRLLVANKHVRVIREHAACSGIRRCRRTHSTR
jgi:hypothetical protein